MVLKINRELEGLHRCGLCEAPNQERVREVVFCFSKQGRGWWFDACVNCVARLEVVWREWPEDQHWLFFEAHLLQRPSTPWKRVRRKADKRARERGLRSAAVRRSRRASG